MANNKIGFDYYNVDTDRYLDIRIKRLKKGFGTSGIAVYDYILCEIYRVRGCFLAWDESTAFDVADYFGLKESLVNEIVNYCCVVGLFDKALLASGSVISSRSIQRRFIEMSTRAKRVNFKIPKEIDIITEECEILPEESGKLPEESGKLPEVSGKGEESKGDNTSPSPTHEGISFPPPGIFDKSLSECYAELSANQSWAETTTMNIRSSGYGDFTFETFFQRLKAYFAEMQNRGIVSKSPADAMSHFASWLKIELKKEKDDRTRASTFKPTTSGPTGKVVCGEAKTTADRKSGADSQKDYSGRF